MRIVTNADDFGYSEDTVRATIECLEQGVVTSASIMPNMPATAAALKYAVAHPELSFGVHLTFVGDGAERAVAPVDEVARLVDEDGRFPGTNVVRFRALTGRLPQAELEREIAAQISVVMEAGTGVSHIDSHRHLHKFKPFRRALQRVLPRFGIARVRRVQDVYLRRPLKSPTYWFGPVWQRRLSASFVTTDHFYMGTSARDLTWEGLERVLAGLPSEHTLEIGVHPGADEPWRAAERVALTQFVETARGDHSFIRWSEVQPPR